MAGKFVNDWEQGRLKSIERALVVLAIISTVFTYFGALDLLGRGDWWDYLLAAALAAASGIMIWAIWLVIFRTAVEETSIVGRIGSLVKALIGAPAILTASTWLMVAGFANDSDKVHMLQALAVAERYTGTASDHTIAAGRLAPQVSRLAADLARWSELEHRDGVSTGIGGPGAVVSALATSSDKLLDLAREVDAASANAAALRAEASELIGKMRAAANSSAPADQRWQEFSAHESVWRATVARIGAKHLLHSVVNGLEAASRDFGTVVALSRNKSIAAKQEAAIAKYRVLIAQQAGPIIAQARSLMAVTLADAPVVERIGAAVAVLTYWHHNIAYWLLGIGIDLGVPAILLISIHVATATTTPRDRFVSRVLGTTVADQAAARMAAQMLERADLDHHSGVLVNDALIGRVPEPEQARELTNAEPADRARHGRMVRFGLMLVAVAVAAALVSGAALYAAGGGQIMIVPPSGPQAPPPAQQELEPGCTLMPNGIMVCDPNAPSPTGVTDRHPGRDGVEVDVGISGAGAGPHGSCISATSPPRPEAVAIVEAILATVGVTRNFQVLESDFERDCIAVAGEVRGVRAIVYDSKRFRWSGGRVVWSEAGIMAHEIGHLLMSHPSSTPSRELEADFFAGHALARLGSSLSQALSWTPLVGEKGGDTHPPRVARIRAAALGWGQATIQRIPATSQNAWLGGEFEMAAATCRLARVARGGSSAVRITCERAGQWVWAD